MLQPEFNITDPHIYHVSTADPLTLLYLITKSIPHWIIRFRKLRPDYQFPRSTIDDLARIRLTTDELRIILTIAFILTIMRYFLEFLCRRYVPSWCIFPRFKHKLPETIWKLIYYGGAWIFSLYVMTMVKGINLFMDPLSMWNDWSSGQAPPVPFEVSAVYSLQTAYYVHSIYATLFMDLWRKDSWLMFFHHFVALALLLLSYADGFVLPGVLLVFLHDSSDAALEMTKLGHYLKKRTNGDHYSAWHIFGNMSFCLFAVLWIIFRLYYFFCKLLYATLYGAVYLGPQDAVFFPMLGIMLIIIFIMNIYWFNFIVRMVIRVLLTGEEPEDNREFDTTAVSGIDKSELDKMYERKRN